MILSHLWKSTLVTTILDISPGRQTGVTYAFFLVSPSLVLTSAHLTCQHRGKPSMPLQGGVFCAPLPRTPPSVIALCTLYFNYCCICPFPPLEHFEARWLHFIQHCWLIADDQYVPWINSWGENLPDKMFLLFIAEERRQQQQQQQAKFSSLKQQKCYHLSRFWGSGIRTGPSEDGSPLLAVLSSFFTLH